MAIDYPITIDVITDNSHGWAIVPVSLMRALGIDAGDFTRHSHVDPQTGTIYAEEDCDITVVLAAYHRATGDMPAIEESWATINPRNMPRLPGTAPRWQEAHAYLCAVEDAAVHS
jgi:hypothetical protein